MCACEWLATYIPEKGILNNGPLVIDFYYLIIVNPFTIMPILVTFLFVSHIFW